MTIAVDLGRKATKTKNKIYIYMTWDVKQQKQKTKKKIYKSTQDSLETDIDDTDLKPFERLMMAKLSKLGENMKELSKNVSKLTNHVLIKVDKTEIIEVMKDTSNKTVAAIKELKDTMKDLTKENRAPSHIPSQALQEESTQILLEQESQKIKQSIIDKWNTNLEKGELNIGRCCEIKTLQKPT